ncbi:MAG TPA: DUF6318 family protein [Blastococcus sp.]
MTRRWLAFIAVGAVLLSGCSKKQEANDTLPSPSAAETTPELPPLGPDDMPMPAEARTQDAAGAEAFVRYYIALINRTSTIMDAKPLRDLSDGCADCNRIADATEQAEAAGRDYVGGQMTILQVGRPLVRGDKAELALRVDQAEFVVLDPSGRPTEGGSEAFSNVAGGATLRWDGTRQTWLVAGLTLG